MDYIYTQLGGFAPNQKGEIAPWYTHTSYTQSLGQDIPQGMSVSRELSPVHYKGKQVFSDKIKRDLAKTY